MTEQPFSPDWVSAPGDTIADLIKELDWSQADLAKRLGYSEKHVSLLLNGKVQLGEELALKLERVLGSTAGFWLRREADYREQLARQDEEPLLNSWVPWLERLPVKDLMHAGVISPSRLDERQKPKIVKQLLRFFGIASPDEWTAHYGKMEIAFRRTRHEQSDVGAISAWLRLGELESEKFSGAKFSKAKFENVLHEIRALTIREPDVFTPAMEKLCAQAGVAFVLVPAISRAHVSGAARWLNPHRPMIQLSLYGKTNDRFWFTFFHECAHLLLHDKKDVFLDELKPDSIPSRDEHQANNWARDFLIPAPYQNELKYLQTKTAVKEFSKTIQIHPGIVVGRLQHEKFIDPSWMNDLKVSYRFGDRRNRAHRKLN